LNNRIKIIGGTWRSRLIAVIDEQGLRPTPARVRETLFNWLQADIFNSQCLDVFSGSGALGFEAASRGARLVVAIENNVPAYQALKDNAAKLSASQMTFFQKDALAYLAAPANTQFDIVFLDPPFGLGLIAQSIELLDKQQWLAPYAKIYVETENTLNIDANIPKNWHSLKHKVAGEVTYRLFENRSDK
jgi:16S rRNA (guanine966-N2)-methyltransferase